MRTVYSTNNAMQTKAAGTPVENPCNKYGCGIAIGAFDDTADFSVNVINHFNGDVEASYARLDRAELIAIRDAIDEELARVN